MNDQHDQADTAEYAQTEKLRIHRPEDALRFPCIHAATVPLLNGLRRCLYCRVFLADER